MTRLTPALFVIALLLAGCEGEGRTGDASSDPKQKLSDKENQAREKAIDWITADECRKAGLLPELAAANENIQRRVRERIAGKKLEEILRDASSAFANGELERLDESEWVNNATRKTNDYLRSVLNSPGAEADPDFAEMKRELEASEAELEQRLSQQRQRREMLEQVIEQGGVSDIAFFMSQASDESRQ